MRDDPDVFVFPELSDEAALALNDFLEQFYTCFQNHYFAQMRRADPPRADRIYDQMPLPIDDPPF